MSEAEHFFIFVYLYLFFTKVSDCLFPVFLLFLHIFLITCKFLFVFIFLLLFFFCFLLFLAVLCGLWDLVSPPDIEPGPPAVKALSPNYWTARELPCKFFNIKKINFLLYTLSFLPGLLSVF